MHPGAERPAAVEAVDRANRGEERLLGDVLRGGRVVDHEVRRPVRARPLAPEQLLERLGRAALGLAHETPLAQALGGVAARGAGEQARVRGRRGHEGRWPVAGHGCQQSFSRDPPVLIRLRAGRRSQLSRGLTPYVHHTQGV